MHEVVFRLRVQGSDNEQEAVDMATDYFCGGDYYRQVTQMETEVIEVRSVQESEATEAR
jgi:hypothetical protein